MGRGGGAQQYLAYLNHLLKIDHSMRRPEILFPLAAPLTSLPGVGAQLARGLAELIDADDARIIDLLWHMPVGIIDRSDRPLIADIEAGKRATLEVTIGSHSPGFRRAPYRVEVYDESGQMTLVFFHARETDDEKNPAARRDAIYQRHM